MPDRILLTQNSQFLKASEPISDSAIRAILNQAASNKKLGENDILNIEREARTTPSSNISYRVSIRVFKTEREVYFFDSSLKDEIFACIVIFEFGQDIALFKKSCGNISDALDDRFEQVSPSDLTSTFDDNAADFQKISLRNMTISEKAMRSRSYEAADLKGLLSTHAAGRSIPYFIKIRIGNILKTISTNSGRLVEMSERQNIDAISEWAYRQIASMQSASGNKTFLDSFAKKVELKDVLAHSQPSAILVEASTLFELLADLDGELLYQSGDNRTRQLSQTMQANLINNLEQVYEIQPNKNISWVGGTARIRINKKTITGSSRSLQRIVVSIQEKTVNLQKFIIQHGLYSVVFDDPKYMYFMGHCFEDTSGISEIPSILEILEPKSELAHCTSEKGNFSASMTAFESISVFAAVEKIHSQDDWIFCDDLGNEWADHITLNKSNACISFIHSKYGPLTNSASKLHDVVGQGIKNLGNLSFSIKAFDSKYREKFVANYVNDGISTALPRVRNAPPGIVLGDYLKELLKNYALHRKCILCCSFMSKAAIQLEFDKILSGEKVAGNITQILWIISSFAHAAKDSNAIPIIYCSP
jgi:hypothetical protein